MKTVSGICLALGIVFFVQLFEVGNQAIRWLGERSLYIYLCHVGVLSAVSIFTNRTELFGVHREIWVYFILAGTLLFTVGCYALFGKLGQLLGSQPVKKSDFVTVQYSVSVRNKVLNRYVNFSHACGTLAI